MATGYESELTRFLKELKARDPDLERRQREARALWWDRELDRDQLRRAQEANVPQRGYVYFITPGAP
jgi:hypothetical protein